MSLINILVKVMKLKKQAYSTSCWWEQEVSLMLAEWQHAQCIDCSGTLPTFWWVGSCYSYHFTVVLDLRMIIFACHFWITVRRSCTKTFNSLSTRDGRCLQHGWILRKVQKGGRGHFQFKNLYCRLWAFVRGIFGRFPKNCNVIFRKLGGGVKGRLEFFRKIIPFGSLTRP